MKSYDHCLYEAERLAFQQLEQLLPDDISAELFPNFELLDDSLRTYLECDLIVIAKSFCAIVELKNWRGSINIFSTYWDRNGNVVADPHKTNNRKCKVLKSSLQHLLPHLPHVPFVQSIVVLTHSESEVNGDDSVFSEVGAWPVTPKITFNGIDRFAEYLKKRTARDTELGKNILNDTDFKKVAEKFNFLSEQLKEDYSDQIPGYRVIDELEHTEDFCVYIAERVPALGGQRFRLRVFGELSDNPVIRATQTRSLDEFSKLQHHENILPAVSHPNEKKLVVEVSEWTDLQTLENCLLREGRIQWETATKIALGIARALAHMHYSSKMLVHRNVSPKSVILNSENVPKLTDFNLVYDPEAAFTVYEISNEVSPYLPPELMQGCVDFKSDIYSWGITFSEMLAGEPLIKHFSELTSDGLSIDQLLKLPTDVPDEIKNLLVNTIRLNVAERLEADEVVKQLVGILDEGTIVATPAHIAESTNTWTRRDKVAEGATSEVYLGDCHGEQAILKLYRLNIGRDRCLQERNMLRLVNSPYVPRYKSFIQWDDGRWCLIEEMVRGDRLRDLIDCGELASLETFKEVARQLLSTLAGMHPADGSMDQSGVIHNDINPNNILFDLNTARSSLIDFGAASPPGPITFRGTYGYISKDLIENGEIDAQPKGDLFGLAVSLWEWVTGQRPTDSFAFNKGFLPTLTDAQRLAVSGWFQAALADGKCTFTSANDMLSKLEFALTAPDDLIAEEMFELPEEVEVPERVEVSILAPTGTTICRAEQFVNYLNSIHNVSANNNNALAESQAVSEFFGDIYVPFPIADQIFDLLTKQELAPVIILTGHAGDGKSTIALDVLKKLKHIPITSPLPAPPKEREVAFFNSRQITIIKDMSELSSEQRYEIFSESLTDTSSAWLIVSNTGPLLGTFTKYYEAEGESAARQQLIENDLLAVLDKPIVDHLSLEKNGIQGFEKPVLAVNLTKLDNVQIATAILQRIVTHSAWESCSSCHQSGKCHIAVNIGSLTAASNVVMDRIRWIYRRLTSYEQRMTLRQMSAHIAYSVTAGLNCAEIRRRMQILTSEKEIRKNIAKYSFGEIFFGSSSQNTTSQDSAIHAIQQLKKLRFGTLTSPQIERSIVEGKLAEWAALPADIMPVYEVFLTQSRKAEKIAARCSLRKLLYLFANINPVHFPPAKTYLHQFLQSPKVIELDEWRNKGVLTLSSHQKRELTRNTLNVLLEEYSGNSAGQYESTNYLYITLRRSDRQVFQATQLVLARFDFNNFDIIYDIEIKLPKLVHRKQGSTAELLLTLPLLDYIIKRGQGDLEDGLDPIYLNQLEYFRSQLLLHKDGDGNEIKLLRVGIDGKVDLYNYEHQQENNTLELLG
jgi:serine/threonine protein kinase